MSKGESTRDGIVEAARKLIAVVGFHGTSFQKVADAVGLSQSAVMHHYRTKVDLFRGVLDYMIQENEVIATRHQDSKDNAYSRLMKYFEVNYEWAIEYDYNAQIMTCLFHFSSYDPIFKDLYSNMLKGSRGKVLDCIYAGEREGIFQLKESATEVGDILHDALLGFILISVTTKIGRKHRKELRDKWETLVNGLTRA